MGEAARGQREGDEWMDRGKGRGGGGEEGRGRGQGGESHFVALGIALGKVG